MPTRTTRAVDKVHYEKEMTNVAVETKNAKPLTANIQDHPLAEGAAGRTWKETPAAAMAARKQEQPRAETKADGLERELAELNRFFPGLRVDRLPQSVFRRMNKGASLTIALLQETIAICSNLAKENEKLSGKVAADEQNKKNKSNTIGSVKSSGGSGEVDDFLAGFDRA